MKERGASLHPLTCTCPIKLNHNGKELSSVILQILLNAHFPAIAVSCLRRYNLVLTQLVLLSRFYGNISPKS